MIDARPFAALMKRHLVLLDMLSERRRALEGRRQFSRKAATPLRRSATAADRRKP